MSDFLTIRRGAAPLLLSLPHAGTDIPAEVAASLADGAPALKDTDWWIDRLYAPLAEALDATTVQTAVSRTAVDVNRDPSGLSLYPGRATTALVPLDTFDGEPLYPPGAEPDAAAVARRRRLWFDPYHAALSAELARLRQAHGHVLLYDCHSIRSRVPRLFDGTLPVFNIGTDDGRSCAATIAAAAADACRRSGMSLVVDGRFKGGWITRHYGRPEAGVHAVQMELACRAYMDETPPRFDETRAERLRAVLDEALAAMLAALARLDRKTP